MEPGILQIDRIRAQLRTTRIGRRIGYRDSVTSTNDEAWRLVEADGADGAVVLAEHQSAGRGRLGRMWASPRGASLLCSVVVMDESAAFDGGRVCLLTAVAVREAIARGTDVNPTIKWPNDLYAGGQKLGGILIESRIVGGGTTAWVLGIGVNCLQQRAHFPPELADQATSLDLAGDQPVDRTALAIGVLTELDRWLAPPRRWSDADLRKAWLACSDSLGRRVILEHAGRRHSGSIIDLDPTAALVVKLDEGGVRVFDAAGTTLLRYKPSA